MLMSMRCSRRLLVSLVLALGLTACPGPGTTPGDGGMADVSLPDGARPGEPVLRVRFEVELDGEPVTGPVEIDGVLIERFVLGVDRLTWHGERGDAPAEMPVGVLDLLAGPMELDVFSVPPGLYSQVDFDFDFVDGAPPFDLVGRVDGEGTELRIDVPMHLEARCEGGAIDVGFDGIITVPVRVRLGDFEDMLRGPPLEGMEAAAVLEALEDAFEVRCGESDEEPAEADTGS